MPLLVPLKEQLREARARLAAAHVAARRAEAEIAAAESAQTAEAATRTAPAVSRRAPRLTQEEQLCDARARLAVTTERDPALPPQRLPPLDGVASGEASTTGWLPVLLLALLCCALTVPDASNYFRSGASVTNFGFFKVASWQRGGARPVFLGVLGTWLQLPQLPQRVALLRVLVAANVAVFLAWHTTSANFMARHFKDSGLRATRQKPWTLLLSAFSHTDPVHLAMNMSSLLSVAPWLLSRIGDARFLSFYLQAAVASSAGSVAWRHYRKEYGVCSLGASGVIYAIEAASGVLTSGTHEVWVGGLAMSPLTYMAVQLLAEWRLMSDELDVPGHAAGALFGAAWALW